MLKEVGASGQISLGKKYARQLFEMQIAADGAVTLTPVIVVPLTHAVQQELAVYKVNPAAASNADGYLTPERMARRAAAAARSPTETQALHDRWEEDHKDARRAAQRSEAGGSIHAVAPVAPQALRRIRLQAPAHIQLRCQHGRQTQGIGPRRVQFKGG